MDAAAAAAVKQVVEAFEKLIVMNDEYLAGNAKNEFVIVGKTGDSTGLVLFSHDHATGKFEFNMAGSGSRATGMNRTVAEAILPGVVQDWPEAKIVGKRAYVEENTAFLKDHIVKFSQMGA